MMIGALLLAAATTGDGIFPGKPHVGGLKLFRSHVVSKGEVGAVSMPPVWGGADCGPGGMGGFGGGPGGPGIGGPQRRFVTATSQVAFVGPQGMSIGWQTGGAPGQGVDPAYMADQLVAPARYNFRQGYIYRLKISNIENHPGLTLFPTLEVAPSVPATDAYLAHNPIPCQFTPEDIDQVTAGNFVTKVIYLPDPKYQELAVAGVETLVSTRLEPGIDPILEADRRGTILMVIRIGGINLEDNAYQQPGIPAGAMPAGPPAGAIMPGGPGMMPGASIPSTPPSIPSAPPSVPSAPPVTTPMPPTVPTPNTGATPPPTTMRPATAKPGLMAKLTFGSTNR